MATAFNKALISKVINRFEKAVRAHEMIGAQHPGDHTRIESEYATAKQALRVMLETK